jgi:D-alanyl-lipoteichoic acid acyltransferase DltB (MBOAT superfamily)
VSLSEWLRDYVYISLGGNRSGLPIRVRNLLITMLLGGIWHGAGWNFLIWGGLQGSYLAVNTVYADLIGRYLPTRGIAGAARSSLGLVVTIVCVMYAWLYFRLGTFDQAVLANQKIWHWLKAPSVPAIAWGLVVCVLAFLVLDLLRRNAEDVFPLEFAGVRRNFAFGLLSGAFVALGLLLIVGAPTQQFIYFQF